MKAAVRVLRGADIVFVVLERFEDVDKVFGDDFEKLPGQDSNLHPDKVGIIAHS